MILQAPPFGLTFAQVWLLAGAYLIVALVAVAVWWVVRNSPPGEGGEESHV